MERERNFEKYIAPAASIGLIVIAAFGALGAFSRGTREAIWQRDQGRSVESGMGGHLECAHYDHTRNSYYDTPENGRLLTPREHYMDHFNNHGYNGLSLEGNIWALEHIWERLSDYERQGLPEPGER